jgi:hypothetical protein
LLCKNLYYCTSLTGCWIKTIQGHLKKGNIKIKLQSNKRRISTPIDSKEIDSVADLDFGDWHSTGQIGLPGLLTTK